MLDLTPIVFVAFLGLVTALPSTPILGSRGDDWRYQYATDSKGQAHLVDLWMNLNDLSEAARFEPTLTNGYHLFTRINTRHPKYCCQLSDAPNPPIDTKKFMLRILVFRNNPSISQPLVLNNAGQLASTNFDASRRTIVIIHSWMQDATSDLTTVLVPAFLAAEDVNIIVVDWSAGASSINYRVVIANTITSGAAVAQFINWLNQATGATLAQYHIVGHGFGGHQAGIVGRNLNGNVAYITGLNPALVGWVNNINRFFPNDGVYTEVIHTNYLLGYLEELAQVDFYPNAGINMPGCDSNACDDARSYFYFAESITTGGFTGRRCLNSYAAVLSLCNNLPETLQMGGLEPKTGSTGVYLLETNPAPPFSLG